MAVVTLTDRPKSVRYRRTIEVFVGVFVLSLCFVELSVGVRVFVIGLSQIYSFSSYTEATESSSSSLLIVSRDSVNLWT